MNTSRWKGLMPSRVNRFHFILRRIWVYTGWVDSLRSLRFRGGTSEPWWDIQAVRLRLRCGNRLMPAPVVQPSFWPSAGRRTTEAASARSPHHLPALVRVRVRDSVLVVWRRRHDLAPVDSEPYPCSALCDQPWDPSQSVRVLIWRGCCCAGSYWWPARGPREVLGAVSRVMHMLAPPFSEQGRGRNLK